MKYENVVLCSAEKVQPIKFYPFQQEILDLLPFIPILRWRNLLSDSDRQIVKARLFKTNYRPQIPNFILSNKQEIENIKKWDKKETHSEKLLKGGNTL